MSKVTKAQLEWLKALGAMSGGISLPEPEPERDASSPSPAQPDGKRTEAKPSLLGGGKVQFGPNAGNDEQAAFREKLKSIQAQLEEIINETPPSPKAGEIKDKIVEAKEQMEGSIFLSDFSTASSHLDNIIAYMAAYRQARAELSAQKSKARTAFEAGVKEIQADLDRAIKVKVVPSGPLAEKREKIIELRIKMYEAASVGMLVAKEPDYPAAQKLLGQIKALLAEYKAGTQPHWKKNYEQALARLKDMYKSTLDKNQWTDQMKTGGAKIEVEKKAVEGLAAKGEYQQAVEKIDGLMSELNYFRSRAIAQEVAKSAFEGRWNRIKDEYLKLMKSKPDEPELQKIQARMTGIDGPMKEKLRKNDFAGASADLDQLGLLLNEYKTAEKNTPRIKYEEGLAKIRPSLEQAVSTFSWLTGPDLVDQQRAVEAKKAEMEKAAKKKDYAQALKHLEALTPLVEDYLGQSKKTPQEGMWVAGKAIALGGLIDSMYSAASGRLKGAAKAYKDAMQLHQDALNRKKSYAREFLIGLFFAGLGGAAGGAVGALFEKSLKVGKNALIDATKDVAKFVTRSLRDAGSDAKDPLQGLNPLTGDGVDLALSVGQRLDEEAAALKTHVTELGRLIVAAANKKSGYIRIEGDPEALVKNDPFLKILGSIEADVQTYSILVWTAWGKDASDNDVWKVIGSINKQTGGISDLSARATAIQKKVNETAERNANRR